MIYGEKNITPTDHSSPYVANITNGSISFFKKYTSENSEKSLLKITKEQLCIVISEFLKI